MPAAGRILFAGVLGLVLALALTGDAVSAASAGTPAEGGTPEPKAAPDSRGGYDHLKPLLIEADDPSAGTGKNGDGDGGGGDDPTAVHVVPQTRAVRMPVRLTRAPGVVEWLVSAGDKHPRTSVLLARCPVRALARALTRAGLDAGRPPVPVGDDAARPPDGPTVRLTLRYRAPDGTGKRLPAAHLLSATPDGEPLADGRWVYVGPQALADGKILLAELSGSLVTTSLRDTSGMVYWVPASSNDGPLYVEAFYARPKAVPKGVGEGMLEIRPAPEGEASK
jgi:hypothetical protein